MKAYKNYQIIKPVRIQRKRTKGWKMPPNTVYVGRPTKWGNPFKHYSREDAVYRFKENLPIWIKRGTFPPTDELKGKNLACWCPLDKLCHADVLLEIANN